MPTEIVTNKWCDPCYKEGVNTPAEEVVVSVAAFKRGKAHKLLLCEPHRKEYYDTLVSLLNDYGVDVDGGTAAPPLAPKGGESTRGLTNPPCPFVMPSGEICGHDASTRAALSSHARSQHGVTLSELLKEPIEFVCLTCPDKPGYGSGTGFQGHRRSVHGFESTKPLLPGENLIDDRELLSVPKPTRRRKSA